MSVVDDEWASFLTQGAIILSNEKNSAKNNVTNSYQKNMDSTMTSYTAIIDTAANNVALKPPSDLSTSASAAGNTLTSKLKPSRQTINVSSLKKLDNTIIDDDDIKTNTNGNKYRETKTTLKTKYKSDSDIDECSNSDCEVEDIEVDSIILDDSSLDVPNSNVEQQPVCSNIYISTKTKISYLNEPIDIKKVFWSIPISPYSTPCECIIKKQIKVSTTDPKELEEIKELLKNEKYYQEQEIEHIDNPEGRIKFKVQLKINVGLCKKDILNYRCKLKRAFFNCFVLIMRIRDHT